MSTATAQDSETASITTVASGRWASRFHQAHQQRTEQQLAQATLLGGLSMLAHRLAASGEPEDVQALVEVEDQADRAAAQLWDITYAELREIRRSLEEFG